ncbi:hypothetical protein BD779DRAFT_1572082 [Infundibulicybe gibba]|nr:hypothetical protein BD779DRAFT_1572082 [Infundibulicybe gibba]
MLLNRNRLADAIPFLFVDVNARTELWEQSGSIDPFKNIYDLVFLMTTRMATCRELTQNMVIVQQLQVLFQTLERSATPMVLLLAPHTREEAKNAAIQELFATIGKFMQDRRQAKVPSSNTIDALLDHGLSNQAIVEFVLNITFAGVLNTGINICSASAPRPGNAVLHQ